jgi:hypothetical protein
MQIYLYSQKKTSIKIKDKNIKPDRHPVYNNVPTVIFFERLIHRSFYLTEIRKSEQTCECVCQNEL